MTRIGLATLSLCLLASTAQAHPRHHYTASVGAQMLGPGLIHMLDSASQAAWPTGDTMGNTQTVSLGARGVSVQRVASSGGGGGLSEPCRQAAHEGGPCGCWAAEHLLNTSAHVYHGVNVWLASDWLRFRHVAAAPGTAAVMRHHVVPVLADNGRTVTVNDSWGVHEVSKRAIIAFVNPNS